MTQIFQNKTVEHSWHCSSVACILQETEEKHEHVACYYFDTANKVYIADSLTNAAKMWAEDGQKDLINVGSCG